MEPAKISVPKLPDMVMCGDHPSYTKTELNAKEVKVDDGKKTAYPRITPSTSRTSPTRVGVSLAGASIGDDGGRSEHALRHLDVRRRIRSIEVDQAPVTEGSPPNRALLQAALGSFRWPPYLVCVWVLVLVLTHALHCALTMLERALPPLRKVCQYFRTWTEETWKTEAELNQRLYPLALAMVTGLMYSLYFGLYLLYSIAVWAVEPLYQDLEDKPSGVDVMETKVTNYENELTNKSSTKH